MSASGRFDLTDAQIEAAREPLPPTIAFFAALEQVCVQHQRTLSAVGGNVLFVIRGVGAWTLVTQGPVNGLYAEATNDEVAFALACEEWVLHELLNPRAKVDLARYEKAGFFQSTGELPVLYRLLALATGQSGNALALRAR